MIYFYSGTPGSGKSLQCAQEIEFWLKTAKKNVVANMQINADYILKGRKGGKFFHLPNEEFDPTYFYEYALEYHDLGKESQSLIVIDEAQVLFSPTAVKLRTQENPRYRQDWLEFFTQHRHLGYDIVIISHFDRLIDAQIRCLFEYNYVHRKANNFKTIGALLTIFKINFFVQVQYWYGCKEKCGSKMFFYKKRYSKIYDSYAFRKVIIEKLKVKYKDNPEVFKKLMGISVPVEDKKVQLTGKHETKNIKEENKKCS